MHKGIQTDSQGVRGAKVKYVYSCWSW